MSSRSKITDALLEARRLLSKSQSDFSAMPEHDLVTLHETLEEITDRLGGLIPGATPPGRIEDFFNQVGEGMLASQTELDRQSFAHNLALPPGALPSAYRIPKVQAEIGFTMSRKRKKGFSIFALGSQQSREKANTNSVSFEIVATPPIAHAVEDLPIAVGFVFQPDHREEIRKLLLRAEVDGKISRAASVVLSREFTQVLILVRKDKWLLCLPQGGDRQNLLYGVLEQSPLMFTSHGPIPVAQARQQRAMQLYEFLEEVSSEQANALALLEQTNN